MKKVFLLMLLPAILGAANLSAQVTIGGQSEPDKFSLLDIVTTNMKKGVHLPRLDITERDALISTTSEDSIAAKGLAVFNLTTDCYNVWSGKQWLSLCDEDMNPLRITTQPAPFTWRRKYDVAGDPNGPASPAAVTLTVVASGSGTLTYAWYEKPKNKNITAHGTELASTASYTPDITAWGMHTYYCVVSNGTDSVVSNYADVAVGCGAKTTDGNWLSFMCYNLGADTTLDPFVYYSKGDSTSKDIKGWLFQWGRVADGHQWRSSGSVVGPITLPTGDQVPSGNDSYGKYIYNPALASYRDWRTPSHHDLWKPYRSIYDPCPAPFTIPNWSDFAAIINDNADQVASLASATSNTWLACGKGVCVKPDGRVTTLFIPLAGRRITPTLEQVGDYAYLATGGKPGVFMSALRVTAGSTALGVYGSSFALSVRCVLPR